MKKPTSAQNDDVHPFLWCHCMSLIWRDAYSLDPVPAWTVVARYWAPSPCRLPGGGGLLASRPPWLPVSGPHAWSQSDPARGNGFLQVGLRESRRAGILAAGVKRWTRTPKPSRGWPLVDYVTEAKDKSNYPYRILRRTYNRRNRFHRAHSNRFPTFRFRRRTHRADHRRGISFPPDPQGSCRCRHPAGTERGSQRYRKTRQVPLGCRRRPPHRWGRSPRCRWRLDTPQALSLRSRPGRTTGHPRR